MNILSRSKKLYVQSSDYRSDSENGRYAQVVYDALKSQKKFDNFKMNKTYRGILEHVTKEQGSSYLEILHARNDQILENGLSTVLKSDSIGNPQKYSYQGIKIPLSPTTLRYLKVASDLKLLFGNKLGCVAEIGGGYGGQALVNDQLLDVRHVRIFDLPIVNKLINRYLNSYLFHGAYETTFINNESENKYDLAISNYAFSELPETVQKIYIKKVLSQSSRGYLTMNSGFGGKRSSGKLSIGELRDLLPEFEVFEENPLTSQFNYIICWGHNKERSKIDFIQKSIL